MLTFLQISANFQKTILKLIIDMKGRILLGLIIISFSFSKAQKFECYLTENAYKHQLTLCFSEKTEKFEAPMEYAAGSFPELAGIDIEVRRKNIGTMMAARPKIDFMFRKKENRKYVVFITDHPEMNAGPIFNEMSECAQAGVFGHELSHILVYNEKNNLQMLWFGLTYLFNKKKIEEETDLIAMKRGFGDQLIEYTRFIQKSPHTNRKYLKKKRKHYLSANDIQAKLLVML